MPMKQGNVARGCWTRDVLVTVLASSETEVDLGSGVALMIQPKTHGLGDVGQRPGGP